MMILTFSRKKYVPFNVFTNEILQDTKSSELSCENEIAEDDQVHECLKYSHKNG